MATERQQQQTRWEHKHTHTPAYDCICISKMCINLSFYLSSDRSILSYCILSYLILCYALLLYPILSYVSIYLSIHLYVYTGHTNRRRSFMTRPALPSHFDENLRDARLVSRWDPFFVRKITISWLGWYRSVIASLCWDGFSLGWTVAHKMNLAQSRCPGF